MQPQPQHQRKRGAALLSAMLIVTLVATFAASALWQQWRAIEVETAERTRVQSHWILQGALDWARLILREDSIATDSDGTDNLAEPWAVPLEEARLATFLAAEAGTAHIADASTDTSAAFLAGSMTDMQSRLNLRNLVNPAGSPTSAAAPRQFARLFEYLGLPQQQLDTLMVQLRRALAQDDTEGNAPLLPENSAQLTWLGLPAETVAALAPYVTLLPIPTKINLNTASIEVLWASSDGLDMAQARSLVQARQTRHWRSVADAARFVGADKQASTSLTSAPINTHTHSVSSNYFEVTSRLRLDATVVQQRSLVLKQRGEAHTLWKTTMSAWEGLKNLSAP